MIAEDLKRRIDGLSADERHELSVYLTKLALENDPDYWKTIRQRAQSANSKRLIKIEDTKRLLKNDGMKNCESFCLLDRRNEASK